MSYSKFEMRLITPQEIIYSEPINQYNSIERISLAVSLMKTKYKGTNTTLEIVPLIRNRPTGRDSILYYLRSFKAHKASDVRFDERLGELYLYNNVFRLTSNNSLIFLNQFNEK